MNLDGAAKARLRLDSAQFAAAKVAGNQGVGNFSPSLCLAA
jgi:hypothetical protein